MHPDNSVYLGDKIIRRQNHIMANPFPALAKHMTPEPAKEHLFEKNLPASCSENNEKSAEQTLRSWVLTPMQSSVQPKSFHRFLYFDGCFPLG
jgi:hypothetical protein